MTKVFDNINWNYLREQKEWLISRSEDNREAEGLLNFLDHFQDTAVEECHALEIEVFPGIYERMAEENPHFTHLDTPNNLYTVFDTPTGIHHVSVMEREGGYQTLHVTRLVDGELRHVGKVVCRNGSSPEEIWKKLQGVQ